MILVITFARRVIISTMVIARYLGKETQQKAL